MWRWAIFAVAAVLIACGAWPKSPPAERPHVMTHREQMDRIARCFPNPHPMINRVKMLSPFQHEIVARFVAHDLTALDFVTLADFAEIDPRSIYCLVMQQRRGA